MSDRTDQEQANRRQAFVDQMKSSGLLKMDAPLASIFDATTELPGDTTSLTIAYDDNKWFAIMP